MTEKSKELGDAANKLKNGLEKIDDTREKVCCIVLIEGPVSAGVHIQNLIEQVFSSAKSLSLD